jgi:hypothetical protein
MSDSSEHRTAEGVPPDPTGIEEPHDILAAEEFAIPQPEPGVPHSPDPEPHDVLAAEEFAFPSPDEAHPRPRGGRLRLPVALGALAAAAAGLLWRRRR